MTVSSCQKPLVIITCVGSILLNNIVIIFSIEPQTFSQDLSSGYFIGEVLSKHGLQDDFDQFSQNK